jgi:DNA processing protein
MGRARLGLSLVCEPGDARLPQLLADHDPASVLAALQRGRRLAGAPSWPDVWVERARSVDRRLEKAEEAAAAAGLRWIHPGRSEWPHQLDDLDHVEPLHGVTGTPLGLWLRGRGGAGSLGGTSVAIVGARDCTPYGAEVASEIAADAADAGSTVVSGAAFGIDAAGHRGALALDRSTVAVLACGADVDYPKAHAALLSRVAEVGLVVSEQAPGQTPTKARFLSRNRIIAGLASGTVVVEARRRSGSLNTLHWADRLGRPTMAVPGPVLSQQSGGTHQAVRDGKAVLVTTGAEVLAELAGPGAVDEVAGGGDSSEFDRLPIPAQRALDALEWHVPRSSREVADLAGIGLHQTTPALALLERRHLATRVGEQWLLERRADLGPGA